MFTFTYTLPGCCRWKVLVRLTSSSLYFKLVPCCAANIDSSWLTNSSLRSHWVSTVVSYVQSHSLDGVNVDFEDAINFTETDKRLGLTLLLRELSRSLKTVLPRAQVCSVSKDFFYPDHRFVQFLKTVLPKSQVCSVLNLLSFHVVNFSSFFDMWFVLIWNDCQYVVHCLQWHSLENKSTVEVINWKQKQCSCKNVELLLLYSCRVLISFYAMHV